MLNMFMPLFPGLITWSTAKVKCGREDFCPISAGLLCTQQINACTSLSGATTDYVALFPFILLTVGIYVYRIPQNLWHKDLPGSFLGI